MKYINKIECISKRSSFFVFNIRAGYRYGFQFTMEFQAEYFFLQEIAFWIEQKGAKLVVNDKLSRDLEYITYFAIML